MEFFAGANTRTGFVSIFEECFSDTEQLYILKGSSGCGKSTLMRKIAKRAEELGYKFDLIYCSGDPDSLDGVIIPEIKFAIADGTSPHVMDVKYPCVRENIINLGQFWDSAKLIPHKKEIMALTDKKSSHYKNAYRALSAAGEAEDILKDALHQSLNRKKLEDIAFKLTEKALKKEKGRIDRIFTSAFTSNGIKTLPTFGKVDTLCRISGRASFELLKAMELIAQEFEASATISVSALDTKRTDAVFFPESNMLFTNLSSPPCLSAKEEKSITTSRLINVTSGGYSKARISAFEKLIKELRAEAMAELSGARAVHGEIESIYIPAMNFDLMNEYTENLISVIFKA